MNAKIQDEECSRWLDAARVAELAKANAVIRANLERLASEPDLMSFLGQTLLEATKQVGAAGGAVIILKDAVQEWRIMAYVQDGQIGEPEFAVSVPCSQAGFDQRLRAAHDPITIDFDDDRDADLVWPGTREAKRRRGLVRMFVLPLVFGGRTVGCIGLSFRHREPLSPQSIELLVALGHQTTLAIEMTRRAHAAKEAAVLVERNRISQEIHDGLAQAFTGILMQLGAAETHKGCSMGSPLGEILSRIRALAKEGLAEARRSVLALKPHQSANGELAKALSELAERSTVSGRVLCTFDGINAPTGLPAGHKHELLRIAQEAVSNAVRHAQPKNVRISMTEESAHWVLAVSDDGSGMKQTAELCAKSGFGLDNMRERAGAIGGQWQIESAPGHGTRVSVRLRKSLAA